MRVRKCRRSALFFISLRWTSSSLSRAFFCANTALGHGVASSLRPFFSSSLLMSPSPLLSMVLKMSLIFMHFSPMSFSKLLKTPAAPLDSAPSMACISAKTSALFCSSSPFFFSAAFRALFSSLRALAEGSPSFFSPSLSSSPVIVPSAPPNKRKRSCSRSPLSFISFSSFENTPPTLASILCASVGSCESETAFLNSSIVSSPSPLGSATFMMRTASDSESSLNATLSFSAFSALVPARSFCLHIYDNSLTPNLSSFMLTLPSLLPTPSIMLKKSSIVQSKNLIILRTLLRTFLPFTVVFSMAFARRDRRKASMSSSRDISLSPPGSI
mmetsp:Transcript_23315/g.48507  ORF Transcript_23315/g.48507 Transcript_23315/m.48507 type:complete len:329 (-) Transcript_23315:2184-3170(-)